MLAIDNETPTTTPLNGLIQVSVTTNGGFQEMNLDYECMWKKDGMFVFKSYDQGGNVVYFKMKEDEAILAIFDTMVPNGGVPDTRH
jgi:hypothetical protein